MWKVERVVLYAVALRGRWVEGRSRSGVPQEVRPVVPVTTSSPRLSFRARSSHCQVPAFPLTHSPRREVVSGAGSHRGCPPHDFWAFRECTCVWSVLRNTGAMWVAVEVADGVEPEFVSIETA